MTSALKPVPNYRGSTSTVGERVELFIAHLQDVERWFNDASRAHAIGVTISSKAAINALRGGVGVQRAIDYTNGVDDSGILHKEQIQTAVAATAQIVHGGPQGLIQGAMQSGKTTTSLCMQFAAPTYYLVTGKPLFPFYLLTVHTSQYEQTLQELQRFVGFYSNLTFHLTGIPRRGRSEIDPVFDKAPTLDAYRESVLKAAFEDELFSQMMKPHDFVATRSWGKKIGRIAARMKKIVDSGFVPLMLIDEPQFGVMDRIIEDKDTGKREKRLSVFKRIFRAIEKALKIPKGSHAFVALSATPYEIYDVQGIWRVKQRLGNGYTGFNFFAGDPIDPTADCTPPMIKSLSQVAHEYREPFLAKINMAAIDNARRFAKLRKKLDIPQSMTHDQYRKGCITALGNVMRTLAKENAGEPFGICIRARNNNEFARTLERELQLGSVFETLHYSGSEVTGMSVKHKITSRKRPHDPYLLFVTNRARMGDAFPSSARYFIELTENFTDMNSMFQGFVGRACGYRKKSTVFLSNANATMIGNVVDENGRYLYTPSRGSLIVDRKRRGRPTGLIAVRREGDATVERFFKKIDERFIENRLLTRLSDEMHPRRSRRGPATGVKFAPIFEEANRVGLFDHIEDPENRTVFGPGYPDFHIVREREAVASTGAVTTPLSYALDGRGGCEVVLREYTPDLKQGGVRARGAMGSSQAQKQKQQPNLMPQIIVRKFDKRTNRPIDDKDEAHRRVGEWRAYAVVLPLARPVTPRQSAEITLPRPEAVFNDNLNAGQVKIRNAALRTAPRGARRPAR